MKDLLKNSLTDLPRGKQSRIAEALGVEPATVTKWKKGYTLPSPDLWPQIEELFGFETGSLSAASSTPPASGGTPAEVMTMLRALSERLDAVEQHLGLPAHARSEPSGQPAP